MIVEVSLEAEASADDRAAVAEVFESAGIQADVKATYIRRSAGLLPWLIVIAVTVRFLWAVPVMKQAGMPGKGSSGYNRALRGTPVFRVTAGRGKHQRSGSES